MKELSTSLATQKLIEKLSSSNCYSYTKATYIDDDGVEVDFTEDLLYPCTIEYEGRPPRYANINYEPASGECTFNVLNYKGKYSIRNTAGLLNDVFKRDRVVKFYDGKYLHGTDAEGFLDVNISTETISHYYTKIDSGNVVLDFSNSEGETLTYFEDLFNLYDSLNYDEDTYSPDGYAVMTIDTGLSQVEGFETLRITTLGTGIKLYVRYGLTVQAIEENGNDSTDWNYYGDLSSGLNVFSLNNLQNVRYIQLGFVFNTGNWLSTTGISDIVMTFTNYVEYVLLGTFLLDDPEFEDNKSPEISTISVTGRNAWKRALDTKINIADLSGGVALDDLIKDISDLCNIPYNNSDIADLSAYGNRNLSTGYDDQVDAVTIYRDILQIIGKEYRLVIDDNNYLKTIIRPIGYDIDFVFNYQNYISARLGEKSDRRIQRMTIQSSNEVLNPYVQLDSDTFVSVSSGVLSWSGGAVAKDYTAVVNSGNISITGVEFNNASTSATFSFTGTGSITVTISGCKFRTTEPTYYNEAINTANIEAKNGYSFREVNPLIISDAEAREIAENYVAEFGEAEYNVTIQDSYVNPLIEVNDSVLIVSANLFETTIYEVLGKTHVLDSETKKRSMFKLIDTGRDILEQGDIVWNRSLYNTALNFNWDVGIIWDATYPIGVTAETINNADNRFTDIDF